jgi:hypothetical protein
MFNSALIAIAGVGTPGAQWTLNTTADGLGDWWLHPGYPGNEQGGIQVGFTAPQANIASARYIGAPVQAWNAGNSWDLTLPLTPLCIPPAHSTYYVNSRVTKISWSFNMDPALIVAGSPTPGNFGIVELKVWVYCNKLIGGPNGPIGPDGLLMPATDISGTVEIVKENLCGCAELDIPIPLYHSISVSIRGKVGGFPQLLDLYNTDFLPENNNFHISVGLGIRVDDVNFIDPVP